MDIMSFVTQPQVMISLAVLIVLLWRISYGYKNGFVAELIGIAGAAVGFALLLVFADTIDNFLSDGSLHLVNTIIKVTVMVIVYKAIEGIAKGLKGVKKVPILGQVDKLLGACFGAVEVYIWVKLLDYITKYDFEGAVRYTIASIKGVVL